MLLLTIHFSASQHEEHGLLKFTCPMLRMSILRGEANHTWLIVVSTTKNIFDMVRRQGSTESVGRSSTV